MQLSAQKTDCPNYALHAFRVCPRIFFSRINILNIEGGFSSETSGTLPNCTEQISTVLNVNEC
jgi:hypothetical protein